MSMGKPNANQAAASAHNWARGTVVQARGSMQRVRTLDTVTAEAKALAERIEQDLHSLAEMMRKRTDQE